MDSAQAVWPPGPTLLATLIHCFPLLPALYLLALPSAGCQGHRKQPQSSGNQSLEGEEKRQRHFMWPRPLGREQGVRSLIPPRREVEQQQRDVAHSSTSKEGTVLEPE